jgi:acyl-CoA thioesterase YciA
VRLGDILSFYSKLVKIGRTSVTVTVEVFAERFHTQGEYIKVTQATFTYVAIDEAGRPRPIERD